MCMKDQGPAHGGEIIERGLPVVLEASFTGDDAAEIVGWFGKEE